MKDSSKIYKWVIAISCICFAVLQFVCFGFGLSLDISIIIEAVSFIIAVGVVVFSNKKITDIKKVKTEIEQDIQSTLNELVENEGKEEDVSAPKK